jgi:hypothetical protein
VAIHRPKKYDRRNDLMSIYDQNLVIKWLRIKRYTSKAITAYEAFGILTVDTDQGKIYIAKNSNKMRIKSHLDWVYYEPKSMAYAIDNDLIDVYYEIMLKDLNSDPNQWKDWDFEQYVKSFYAHRHGRASLI